MSDAIGINGRVINSPYCVIVSEDLKETAILIAEKPRSGCWAVFIHHCPIRNNWIITEGITPTQLSKDRDLEKVWPITPLIDLKSSEP